MDDKSVFESVHDAKEAGEAAIGNAKKNGEKMVKNAKREGRKIGKVVAWIVRCVVCLIIGIVIGVLLVKFGFFNTPNSSNEVVTTRTTLNATTVREKLEAVGDLSTYRDEYTDIQEYNKNQKVTLPNGVEFDLPLTDDSSLLVFTGTVDFRYNLKNMNVNVDNDAKTITVTMPELEAVSTSVNDCVKEYKIADSIFTTLDINEYEEARAAIRESKRDELLADPEIVSNAQESAKNTLTSLLLASDDLQSEGYTVNFVFK